MNSDDKLKKPPAAWKQPADLNPHGVSAWVVELNLKLLTVMRIRNGNFSQETMRRMVRDKARCAQQLEEAFGPIPHIAPREEVLAMLKGIADRWLSLPDEPGDHPPALPYLNDGSGRKDIEFMSLA